MVDGAAGAVRRRVATATGRLVDGAEAMARRRFDRLAVPCDTLHEMYSTRSVALPGGNTRELVANISVEHANALYRTVLEARPASVVEIGMAFGASSLAILTALAELGGDRTLRSIDPWQRSSYGGAGRFAVERAGLADRHVLVEEPDHLALPALERAGTRIQFAYVDGAHTFDRTLLDFFYIDRMLDDGGLVAFNDCAMPSVHRVARFVTRHRRYEEVDVGLPRRFVTRSARVTVGRVLLRRSKRDRYFRKIETWEPAWSFWRRF